MKLIKNAIETPTHWFHDAQLEVLSEVAETLVRQNYLLSIYALRFGSPAPDQVFYQVVLHQVEDDVVEITDMSWSELNELDRATYGTLPKAYQCYVDSLKCLVGDPKEIVL